VIEVVGAHGPDWVNLVNDPLITRDLQEEFDDPPEKRTPLKHHLHRLILWVHLFIVLVSLFQRRYDNIVDNQGCEYLGILMDLLLGELELHDLISLLN
jgi:hypothetical protein